MFLKEIELRDFTNYEKVKSELSPDINILIGDNAQGKSNFLNSIYYLSTGSPVGRSKDKDLVRWGRNSFKISASFLNKYGENEVVVNYLKNKKQLFFNQYEIEKTKDYLGYFLTVYFSPEDLYIVKGDPSLRRKYLDDELIQTDKNYYVCMKRYKKILEQRNNLLKDIYYKKESMETMAIWEENLSLYGTKILEARMELIDALKRLGKESHKNLSQGREDLDIIYESKLSTKLLTSGQISSFQSLYFESLKSKRKEDVERGYTSIGPHRDDIDLLINGKSVKKFGSQGQQRTTALSLKIAEVAYIKEKKGEYPILLLDDVLSELDKNRKNQLLLSLSGIQTLITTNDLNDINEEIKKDAKIIKVNDGRLEEITNDSNM